MAGNIQNVNLAKLKAEIDDYDAVANKLHQSVSSISTNMKNLTTCWTGKRVNTILNLWNSNLKSIDDQTFYFAMKIHLILLEIYDQYNALEKGAPKDSSYGYGWGGILKAPLTDENKISFDQARATTIVKEIDKEKTNVQSYLKQLVTKLDSMQAYSDSLKTLATTYKATATSLEKSLFTLCNNIGTEANKAIQDVKTTEGFNESDAARAKSTNQ